MALVKIASINDVKPGKARVVRAGGREIALYNVGGKFYATSNVCPHRGGPLGEGELEGSVITCPHHAWQFDVTTGTNVRMPLSKVQTFKVVVQDNDVMVDVS